MQNGMEGMLAGSGGVTPGIDMRDPRVQRIVRILAAKGITPTRVNIAEALAMETGQAPAAPKAPATPAAPGLGQRVAPEGSAEQRAEQRGRAKQGSTQGLTPEQKRRFGIK